MLLSHGPDVLTRQATHIITYMKSQLFKQVSTPSVSR